MFAPVLVLAFIIILGILGAICHKMNIDAVYKKVKDLSAAIHSETEQKGKAEEKKMSNEEKMKNFRRFLYNPQGSTFNTLALSAWLLLIVGIFFTFLLTPQISEDWTFLKAAYLVSSSLGIFFFGMLAMIFGLIIVIVSRPPDVYSLYIIPKGLKRAIMASWLILLVPIAIPTYLAVLYPYAGSISDWIDIAFVCLAVSQILLLSPIFIKALGVKI
ncbi:MAG: hypothetical protein M0Q13_08855 [Methanothrix sp.]|jgi:hypothetical protein|nr:hypothetical protein [Methanothrix sp.]